MTAQHAAEQMELRLFAPPTFEQILAQQKITGLSVVFNSRLRKGWRVSVSRFTRKKTLMLPAYFESAPKVIKCALIGWTQLATKRKSSLSSEHNLQRKMLERSIWNYAAECGVSTHKTIDSKRIRYSTAGICYDLREVFETLNAAYFNNRLQSFIRWGASTRRSYQTSCIDKQGHHHNLITIAKSYNRKNVPRFAIEGIVYHEMLHIAVPPYKKNNRNIIHGPEFKEAEHNFVHFAEWRSWEKEHLSTLPA
jgi:hypothetical protein